MAMAIWPFIFIKENAIRFDKTLINHEKIHFRQQIEMLWFPFFIWYACEFLVRLIQYKNWDKAYRAISFEKEAYTYEATEDYLKTKRFWSFVHFLKD